MEHYYQHEIECASREQLRAWQDQRLVKIGTQVYGHGEDSRKKLGGVGV